MTENDSQESENDVESSESSQQNDVSFTYQLNDDFKEHPVNSLPASCRRVKLYEIGSSTDSWIDKGTGFCFFDGDVDAENPKLLVSLEHYGIKSLVSTYIKDNTDYSSQNDSIIIWHEGTDTRLYRALSFQNVVGHNACWSYIRNYVDENNIQPSTSTLTVQSNEFFTNTSYRILPVPTVNSIKKLESSLETYLCQNNFCDGLYLDLLDKKWLKELFELMNKCILSDDLQTVSSISSILLKLVLNWCGSLELMHIFVSDDIFFDLLKSFEYDIDLISQNIKMEHVKFFKKFVRHHEVVPVNNSTFYQLIHSNYRINYLKDVILPRHLDEFSIQRINSTVYSNMTEIMNIILTEENNFFDHLKSKLASNYIAALFLRELLLVARSSNLVSQADRNSLILMVRNYQLLNELTGYLDDSSEACKMYKETLLPLNQQSENYYQNIKSLLSRVRERRLATYDDSKEGYFQEENEYLSSDSDELNSETFYSIDSLEGCREDGLNEPTSLDETNDTESLNNFITKVNKTEPDEKNLNRDDYRPNLLCTSRHRLIEPLSLVVEIFHICQDIFPAIVRSAVFIDSELHGSPKLLIGFCNVLLKIPNEGLQSQTREIISRLLDPKNMDLPEKDEICNIFYDKGVLDYLMYYLNHSTLLDYRDDEFLFLNKDRSDKSPLKSQERELCDDLEKELENGIESTSSSELEYNNDNNSDKNLTKNKLVDNIEMNVNAKLNIMEILSLCAREHKHRFKLRLQSQKIPMKVIKSSMSPYDKFLVVGSIKFIKVCIQMKDKLVNKHIIRYNILRYVMWILMYKVDRHNLNGSILESVCLSLLSTIESVGTDSLIVYLFEDSFCLTILNKFKKFNTCYGILFNNLQRMYTNIKNKSNFDENRWFEEDDDDEDLILVNKNKGPSDTLFQDNIITLYNSTNNNILYDDDYNLQERWIMNKKLHVSDNTVNNTNNKKITVKLKSPRDDNNIVDEFMMDTQDNDVTN